jgi:hypothetical protein
MSEDERSPVPGTQDAPSIPMEELHMEIGNDYELRELTVDDATARTWYLDQFRQDIINASKYSLTKSVLLLTVSSVAVASACNICGHRGWRPHHSNGER